MVEQSMKRRSVVFGSEKLMGGRGGCRILWKTFLTCEGSGSVVITTSYWRHTVVSGVKMWPVAFSSPERRKRDRVQRIGLFRCNQK